MEELAVALNGAKNVIIFALFAYVIFLRYSIGEERQRYASTLHTLVKKLNSLGYSVFISEDATLVRVEYDQDRVSAEELGL
jgi:hypothetical protein